ncbi:MAG TPA: hypothetical protein VF941_19910 [Clostridia bacterium]
MGPINPIVGFIKCKYMETKIKVTMTDGAKITGKVVEAFDSLVGIEVRKHVIYINSDQIVTFRQQ